MTPPSLLSRFRGCLLGGAVGDALGAPVEFTLLPEIIDEYGPEGPSNLEAGGFPAGSFTDDTQMTMCVAACLVAHGRLDPADLADRCPRTARLDCESYAPGRPADPRPTAESPRADRRPGPYRR